MNYRIVSYPNKIRRYIELTIMGRAIKSIRMEGKDLNRLNDASAMAMVVKLTVAPILRMVKYRGCLRERLYLHRFLYEII